MFENTCGNLKTSSKNEITETSEFELVRELRVSHHNVLLEQNLEPPPWFDRELFQKGQRFCRANLFSLFISHLIGLSSILSVASIHKILLDTQQASNARKAFRRYFDTLLHVKYWYEDDIYDSQSRGSQSLFYVQRRHQTLAKKFLKRRMLEIPKLDFVVTLWAFIGPTLLFPKKLGIDSDAEDVQAFIHFWRTIGFHMGIDAKSDICSGSVGEVEHNCEAVLNQIVLPSLTKPPPTFFSMVQNIFVGLKFVIPFIDCHSFLSYAKRTLTRDPNVRSCKWQFFLKVWILETMLFKPLLGHLMRRILNGLLHLAIKMGSINRRWSKI